MHSLRTILRYFRLLTVNPMNQEMLRELSRLLAIIFSTMAIYEIILLLETYPVRWFIDELSQPLPNHTELLKLNGLVLGVAILANLVHCELTIRRVRYFWRNWRLTWGYGHWHQLHLCTSWHLHHSTGEKESIVSKNVNKIERMIDDLIFLGIPMFARIFVITSFVCWVNIYYGLAIMAGLGVFTVVVLRNERVGQSDSKAFREEIKAIENEGTELVQNWSAIKQLGLEDEFAGRHIESLAKFTHKEDRRFDFFMRNALKQDFVSSATRFGLFLAIGSFFVAEQGIGTVFVISGLCERVFSNLHNVTDLQRHLKDGVEGMNEFSDVLETQSSVPISTDAIEPRRVSGHICFENVSFTYPNTNRPALINIDEFWPAGTKVAMVGHTGSGKSSLVNLLIRLFDPTSGRVTIDGIDLRKFNIAKLRRMIGYVSQNFKLFQGTIADNIDVWRGYSQSEVIAAAKRAGAHDFIMEKGGYTAPIGEDGVQLSGGQRQRIAIARALVGNPRIIIFDEATSALDVETQAHVQRALDELVAAGDITLVMIAHRLSTTKIADRILVFHQGQIIEAGTHSELLRLDGHYNRLCQQELGDLIAA